jgi:hypothetical protein|tara:strand:+ start:3383 stop:3850 length:468 start_codon:yes stop_codon:yes gene_type:complete
MQKKNLKDLYNNKHTIISKKHINVKLPDNFDRYEGMIEKSIHTIDKIQIETDQLYNSHIVIKSDLLDQYTLDQIIKRLTRIKFDHNQVYISNVVHHGEYKKCIIDSDYLICNSYMLPFIGYNSRVAATEYGNLLNHRARLVRMQDFDNTFKESLI